LLGQQFFHAVCGHRREQADNAFIAPKGYGGAHKVLDRSRAFSFHPSPRSVGHTCFCSCRLLGKIKGQAALSNPLSKACHLISERENHRPYMAVNP
jgi:hypothetical protein